MTVEEYARQPPQARLARLALTPNQLAAALAGRSDELLSRRPDAKSWAAKEVVCHLRDTEESFLARFHQVMAMDAPRFVRSNPNRWAEERQYLTNDAAEALRAFARRRDETLELVRTLARGDWQRAGVHLDSRGRRTLDELLAVVEWHDDNHLDQLARALEGRA